MRVLWVSNDPRCPSGYGTQTAQAVRRIANAGHDVAVLANYGAGWVTDFDGVPVFPHGRDQYGNDVLDATAKFWDADLVLILFDAWAMKPEAVQDHRTAVWCPVDHLPVPPKVTEFFVKSGAVPVAMSRWGRDLLDAQGLPGPYVPHGIDTELFRPVDRSAARAKCGLPDDRFVVGMVSTNNGISPARKAFDVAFRTFSAFCRAVPDALLYVHARMAGDQQASDLGAMATHYDIPPDNILFAPQFAYHVGFSDEGMTNLYSSFDVLSFATMGEGFGLPALEAQACGTPVISSEFSAQSELNECGWRVAGNLYYDELQKADFFRPDDRSMLGALAAAYQERGTDTATERSRACREFAVGYDADRVFDEFWVPALEQLAVPTDPIVVPA